MIHLLAYTHYDVYSSTACPLSVTHILSSSSLVFLDLGVYPSAGAAVYMAGLFRNSERNSNFASKDNRMRTSIYHICALARSPTRRLKGTSQCST